MIEVILFDFNGVLQKNLCPEDVNINGNGAARLSEALSSREHLIGPKGTLAHLLETYYHDIKLSASDIFRVFAQLPAYDEVWSITQQLYRKDRKIGILSDQSAESTEIIRIRYGPRLEPFFPVYFSPEVKRTKKDDETFHAVQREMAASPGSILLVDDHGPNIARARNLGWLGIEFKGHEQLQEELKIYGLL